ncbi:MAG: DNA polymerase IV [Microgenomates group bacterium]|nr:DNA polymerase IV [Microgenomates group bacterium]
MFLTRSWPNVILHLDGDAFFASVMQAVHPYLKGKPIVTGKERGIATSVSYEAKKYGVKRGMPFFEIKKICPSCLIVKSDYQMFELFSQKIFNIIRSFTPMVEEYSIDEAFADIKGLRRPLNLSYQEIALAIKKKVEDSLNITVSVGVSLNKSLAKLASSFKKPSGLTIIDGLKIEKFLSFIPIENVWGIGENTASYLKKFAINTALDFALKSESFVKKKLTKPFFEIWLELHGYKVYEINSQKKCHYQSISKSETFSPPTNNFDILKARILNQIEEAFTKARYFKYLVGKITIFLKSQNFLFSTTEIKLIEKIAHPLLIREKIHQAVKKIYQPKVLYRSTGCILSDLTDNNTTQLSLFSDPFKKDRAKKIYPLYESRKIDFATCLLIRDKIKEKKYFRLPVLKLNNLTEDCL